MFRRGRLTRRRHCGIVRVALCAWTDGKTIGRESLDVRYCFLSKAWRDTRHDKNR